MVGPRGRAGGPAAVDHAARTRSNERVGFELRHHLPPELVLASVRGPRQVGGGYAWFALDATLSLGAIEDSATAVLNWLHSLDQRRPVGILGFSQGVATAFQMVRREPDRFAYAVNLSGAVVPFPVPGDARLAGLRLPVFWGRGRLIRSFRRCSSVPPEPGCPGTPTSPSGSIRASDTTCPSRNSTTCPPSFASAFRPQANSPEPATTFLV